MNGAITLRLANTLVKGEDGKAVAGWSESELMMDETASHP